MATFSRFGQPAARRVLVESAPATGKGESEDNGIDGSFCACQSQLDPFGEGRRRVDPRNRRAISSRLHQLKSSITAALSKGRFCNAGALVAFTTANRREVPEIHRLNEASPFRYVATTRRTMRTLRPLRR